MPFYANDRRGTKEIVPGRERTIFMGKKKIVAAVLFVDADEQNKMHITLPLGEEIIVKAATGAVEFFPGYVVVTASDFTVCHRKGGNFISVEYTSPIPVASA